MLPVYFAGWHERGQSRNCGFGHGEELGVALNADALIAECCGCGDRRTATHKRIEHNALPERQRSPNNLAHERLWLQRRVRGNVTFWGACWRAPYHVTEGLLVSYTPQASGLPLAQIILHPPFAWSSEKTPWFPAGARHDSHILKLFVCILGPVTAAQRLNQTNNLAPLLEASVHHCKVDQVRKKWVGCNEDVPARHKHSQDGLSPAREELAEVAPLFLAKDSEARNRPAYATIKRWWNPPHATFSPAKLRGLFWRILLEAIRWVRDDCVNRIRFSSRQPGEAVVLDQLVRRVARGVRGVAFVNDKGRHSRQRAFESFLSERLAQHAWCLRRVVLKNLSYIGGNMAGEDQERSRIDLPGFRQTLDHLGCWLRLSSFEARQVALGHLQFLRESFQRPTARFTLRLENGSKLRCRRRAVKVLGVSLSLLSVLHATEDSGVYQICQPSSGRLSGACSRGPSGWSANNSMQRTALRAAADAERYRAEESSTRLAGCKSSSGKG